MKASSHASSQYGQCAHGSTLEVSLWQSLYSLFTGRSLLYCKTDMNHADDKIPLISYNNPTPGKSWKTHGFWDDEAGAEYWETSVTKAYTCSHPECVAWAEQRNREHKKFYSDPKNRRELREIVDSVGCVAPCEYDLSSCTE